MTNINRAFEDIKRNAKNFFENVDIKKEENPEEQEKTPDIEQNANPANEPSEPETPETDAEVPETETEPEVKEPEAEKEQDIKPEEDKQTSTTPLDKDDKDKLRKWLVKNKKLTNESFLGLVGQMGVGEEQAYTYIFAIASTLLKQHLKKQK
jgi:hypothetical protein